MILSMAQVVAANMQHQWIATQEKAAKSTATEKERRNKKHQRSVQSASVSADCGCHLPDDRCI